MSRQFIVALSTEGNSSHHHVLMEHARPVWVEHQVASLGVGNANGIPHWLYAASMYVQAAYALVRDACTLVPSEHYRQLQQDLDYSHKLGSSTEEEQLLSLRAQLNLDARITATLNAESVSACVFH